jgi:primosomal protein N'
VGLIPLSSVLLGIAEGEPAVQVPAPRFSVAAAKLGPGYQGCNPSQRAALDVALDEGARPLTLIQGPPGTGKTRTLVALTEAWLRGGARNVLVCAPSNVAADLIAERLDAYVLDPIAREGMVPGTHTRPQKGD